MQFMYKHVQSERLLLFEHCFEDSCKVTFDHENILIRATLYHLSHCIGLLGPF